MALPGDGPPGPSAYGELFTLCLHATISLLQLGSLHELLVTCHSSAALEALKPRTVRPDPGVQI